jgi:hypothetical protein
VQEFSLERMIQELEGLLGDKVRTGSDQFFTVLYIDPACFNRFSSPFLQLPGEFFSCLKPDKEENNAFFLR